MSLEAFVQVIVGSPFLPEKTEGFEHDGLVGVEAAVDGLVPESDRLLATKYPYSSRCSAAATRLPDRSKVRPGRERREPP